MRNDVVSARRALVDDWSRPTRYHRIRPPDTVSTSTATRALFSLRSVACKPIARVSESPAASVCLPPARLCRENHRMALPPSLHAQGPIRAVVLALLMSISIFMAVLACALPGNWWPMMAVAANLVAVISWGMFQPGIGCIVQTSSAAFGGGNTGICGPPVFELWGKWLTGFFGASSFAAAIILRRTGAIVEEYAFYLTITSVCMVYLTTWYAVETSNPPGGSSGMSQGFLG